VSWGRGRYHHQHSTMPTTTKQQCSNAGLRSTGGVQRIPAADLAQYVQCKWVGFALY
jgi:hypothetical protein